METRITFVRHAESWSNVRKELSCKLRDDWLSDKGQIQAIQTANYLSEIHKNYPFTNIIASPMKRTVQTATFIASQVNLPVELNSLVTEYDFGNLEEEENTKETWKAFYNTFDQWPGNPDLKFPNGESYTMILQRLEKFLNHILENYKGKNIIVLSHAGPIVTIAKRFSDAEASPIPNCSITTIRLDNEPFATAVERVGDFGHLTGEAAEIISPAPIVERKLLKNNTR